MTPYQAILKEAMADLPGLIQQTDIWVSKLVDYETPVVERLWTSYKDCRLSLHKIHPCATPLKHVHPWPAAVRVLSGKYEMEVGIVEDVFKDSYTYTMLGSFVMSRGSEYDLTEKNVWHTVNPIGSHSISMMIMGKPWEPHPSMASQPWPGELKALSAKQVADILKEVDYSIKL